MSLYPTTPSGEHDRNRLDRRRFLTTAAAGAAAVAGVAAVPPGRARATPPAARVHWSSEATAAGFEPKSSSWWSDPEAGLRSVPHRLSRQADIPFVSRGNTAGDVITVDPTVRHQRVLGVGSSTEESTVFNLAKMSPQARREVLTRLHHPTQGAGFDLTRICFGASDFTAREFYTYADEFDPDLSEFSIRKDIEFGIVATLLDALAINPDLKVTATPWSAPPWMKDSNSVVGGALLDEHIPTFARYHRMAVQAYARQGVPIHAVTVQNEPGYVPPDYPGMRVTPEQEHKLIDAVRAEFDAHGLDTRIWCFDWNFGAAADYVPATLGSREAGYTSAYGNTDAIAFHDYTGEPTTMSTLKDAYPDLDVLVNERMLWGTQGANRIAQYFRNHATAYQAWVTMLDQNIQPEKWSGVPDPTALIQNPDAPDTYWALPEYYLFAQYSKFVQRNARRIKSTEGTTDGVTNVAFLNPDDTVATIVINGNARPRNFTLRSGERQFTDTLPAKTVGTYVWN